MNLEHVAHRHLGLADVHQVLHAAVGPYHAVDAGLSRMPARRTERAVGAAVGEDAGRHRLQEAHAPHATIATAPAARAARALPDLVAFQPHREAELQHLGVGQA